MAKESDEDFEISTKCWICYNVYLGDDVKARDHCHATAHRDYNINVKLNHKISIMLHSLKNYDLHLIVLKLGKLNFKINVISNILEKYPSFNINNKLIFIDSSQFSSSSLNSLVESLGKNDFKYLSQEFDSKVLHLVRQKGFYSCEHMSGSEKVRDELPSKKKLTVR